MRLYAANYGGYTRLVKANHRETALRHVAQDLIDVRIAKPIEVAELVAAGVKIETAGLPSPSVGADAGNGSDKSSDPASNPLENDAE